MPHAHNLVDIANTMPHAHNLVLCLEILKIPLKILKNTHAPRP